MISISMKSQHKSKVQEVQHKSKTWSAMYSKVRDVMKIIDCDNSDFSGVYKKYAAITMALIKKKISIATLESCTAGTVVSLLTDTEGSSAVVHGGVVVYCNDSKIANGVSSKVIDTFGVYSAETAITMAASACDKFGSDIGIGITGTLSNVDPANDDSIPGEVYFAIQYKDKTDVFFINGVPQMKRSDGKLYVADKVADELITIINSFA